MKKKLLLLFFIGSFSVTAQTNKGNAYYFTTEGYVGNYLGGDIGFNYIYNDTYSARIGVSANLREAASKPDDFKAGFNGLLSFGADVPYDHFISYRLDVGKIYYLNSSKTIRANMSVGLGFTVLKEPTNFQSVESGGLINLFENYTYSYRSYNTMSLIMNPKIEFPITRFIGFSVSPMVQINKDRIFFGIGVGSMLGILKVRDEIQEIPETE